MSKKNNSAENLLFLKSKNCYITEDEKSLNFNLVKKNKQNLNISIHCIQNENKEYETKITVQEYDKTTLKNKINLTFTSEEALDIKEVYQNFEITFENWSDVKFQEILEEYIPISNPKKITGTIHNTEVWNELKNEDNIEIKISEDKNYNGKGDISETYIKNDKENSLIEEVNFPGYIFKRSLTTTPDNKSIFRYEDPKGEKFSKFNFEMTNDEVKYNGLSFEEMIKNNVIVRNEIKKNDNLMNNVRNFIEEIKTKLPNVKKTKELLTKILNSFKKINDKEQLKQQKKIKGRN